MIISILYIILAILGLSFLIFIHELGHYWMAKRQGMKVETFSIGFGTPIYSWQRGETTWQIGWLLFGGYVKIVGMDTTAQVDPYSEKEGFFGKSPLARIKVAAMGPIVNIVFAFFVFLFLWLMGGREKGFNEYTHKIGWVDSNSDLYSKGIRPGDEIVSYSNQPYEGAKDHIYAPITAASNEIEVKGYKVDYAAEEKLPYAYKVRTYPHPNATDKDLKTVGILNPASYVIYDRLSNGQENPLPEGSPMLESGIQYGDRIVWADGQSIYAIPQLHHLLNDSRALLTVQRGDKIIFRRVPRIRVDELKLEPGMKEELIDWQFEARLNDSKFLRLYAIPYNLNNEGVVEGQVKFIDNESNKEAFPEHPFSSLETSLEPGDKILSVDGHPVKHSHEILSLLQEKHVNLIVQRGANKDDLKTWKDEDSVFDQQFKWNDLQAITSKIGLPGGPSQSGNLFLLNPVVPKSYVEFKLSNETQALLTSERQALKKEIEKIEDPEKRAHALMEYNNLDKQLLLGIPLQDQKVQYNPNPFTLFSNVLGDIWKTLTALFTGSLNPKWMSGPVGIVQAAYDYSMVSLKEALFLLGMISLNLGILNLLPLPVLDGGTICFSFYELITGKRMKPKTIEKLIIPFAILLIGFFIFLTYHDVIRLLKGFFQ